MLGFGFGRADVASLLTFVYFFLSILDINIHNIIYSTAA